MRVEKVYGTIGGGDFWTRTVLKTDGTYTPYVICTGYDEKTQSWSSAYGYYTDKQSLAATLLDMISKGAEFHGELIF